VCGIGPFSSNQNNESSLFAAPAETLIGLQDLKIQLRRPGRAQVEEVDGFFFNITIETRVYRTCYDNDGGALRVAALDRHQRPNSRLIRW
jgi:hypothetical protein